MTGLDQLRELSVSERIQLVEDLWDTIVADAESVRLSEAQTAELDRRLDRFEEDPSEGVEWGALKTRILNSL
ncbi:MAG: addiction module protein [Verrucomicrobiae bacterium]|nr:addiction module protein [Verrucomicrobiae bacterium]